MNLYRRTLQHQVEKHYIEIGKKLLLQKKQIIIQLRCILITLLKQRNDVCLGNIIRNNFKLIFQFINSKYSTYWTQLLTNKKRINHIISVIFGTYIYKISNICESLSIYKPLLVNQDFANNLKFFSYSLPTNNYDKFTISGSCLKCLDICSNLHLINYYSADITAKLTKYFQTNKIPYLTNFFLQGLGYWENCMTTKECAQTLQIHDACYKQLNMFMNFLFTRESTIRDLVQENIKDNPNYHYKEFIFRGDIDKHTKTCEILVDINLMFGCITCPDLLKYVSNLAIVIHLQKIYEYIFNGQKELKIVSHGFFQSEYGNKQQDWHRDGTDNVNKNTQIPQIVTMIIAVTQQECNDDKTNGSTMFVLNSHHHPTNVDSFGDRKIIQPILNLGDAIIFGGQLLHCAGKHNLNNGNPRILYYVVFHLMDKNDSKKYGLFDKNIVLQDNNCSRISYKNFQIVWNKTSNSWVSVACHKSLARDK